jgi:hypothetical protein
VLIKSELEERLFDVRKTSPTLKPRKKYSPSIPEHIHLLITNKRRARALYQRSRLPSHKRNFNNLANFLRNFWPITKIKTLLTISQI